MTPILQFIHARLADDERTAQAATPGEWMFDPTGACLRDKQTGQLHEAVFAERGNGEPLCVATTGLLNHPWNDQSQADARHIADNGPRAALRRCTLIRAILRHSKVIDQMQDAIGAEWGPQATANAGFSIEPLRDIAAYWSTHPDYQPEWAPA